jgi:hypothetical protein
MRHRERKILVREQGSTYHVEQLYESGKRFKICVVLFLLPTINHQSVPKSFVSQFLIVVFMD